MWNWSMGPIVVLEEWSFMKRASGGLCAVNPGIWTMPQWCAGSWTVGRLIRLPPWLSLGTAQDKPLSIKLNAMDLSLHWISANNDHLEIKRATSPLLLVLSAQVRESIYKKLPLSLFKEHKWPFKLNPHRFVSALSVTSSIPSDFITKFIIPQSIILKEK